MSKYWRTFATDDTHFFALYAETYEDAVHFDLSQAEDSILRSFSGDFPHDMAASEEALAERAFHLYARRAHLTLPYRHVEQVDAIPRCLHGIGVGGTEETCVVVVFQQPSAPHLARP